MSSIPTTGDRVKIDVMRGDTRTYRYGVVVPSNLIVYAKVQLECGGHVVEVLRANLVCAPLETASSTT